MQRQFTFEDLKKEQIIKGLSKLQTRALRLLNEGLTKSSIAKRLKVSRVCIGQILYPLEQDNLIKRKINTKYNVIYELSPQLQKILGIGLPTPNIKEPVQSCPIRVHYVRRKYNIINKSQEVSIDPRTGYVKKWRMRGADWYKYSYTGGAGRINISMDVNPRSVIAYPDAGQRVPAEDIKQSEDITNISLHEAVKKFVHQQRLFGVIIETEDIGEQITLAHYGGVAKTKTPVVQAIIKGEVKNWFGDQSLDELGLKDKGYTEIETTAREEALRFEQAMALPAKFDHLPTMIKEALDPLHQDFNAVTAHIMAGETSQFQINQQNAMILQLHKKINAIEEKQSNSDTKVKEVVDTLGTMMDMMAKTIEKFEISAKKVGIT